MTINHRRRTARSWGRTASVAAGTAVAAAAIPLLAVATAHADATTDLLGGGADLLAAAAVPDIGSLADIDVSVLAAAPTTIPEAIAASLVPITTANGEIDAAQLLPDLSASAQEILSGQEQVLMAQTDFVNMIGDLQLGYDNVDVADLVKLDGLLTLANDNILDATTGYISSLDGTMAEQLTAAFGLVSADLGGLGTDLQVAGIGATADLLGMFGIDPSFLFDGLTAGL